MGWNTGVCRAAFLSRMYRQMEPPLPPIPSVFHRVGFGIARLRLCMDQCSGLETRIMLLSEISSSAWHITRSIDAVCVLTERQVKHRLVLSSSTL